MTTDQRSNGYGESTLTVKWWAVICLFIGIYGWFFMIVLTHENRLTKVETTLEVSITSMTKSIDRLACTLEKLIDERHKKQ